MSSRRGWQFSTLHTKLHPLALWEVAAVNFKISTFPLDFVEALLASPLSRERVKHSSIHRRDVCTVHWRWQWKLASWRFDSFMSVGTDPIGCSVWEKLYSNDSSSLDTIEPSLSSRHSSGRPSCKLFPPLTAGNIYCRGIYYLQSSLYTLLHYSQYSIWICSQSSHDDPSHFQE